MDDNKYRKNIEKLTSKEYIRAVLNGTLKRDEPDNKNESTRDKSIGAVTKRYKNKHLKSISRMMRRMKKRGIMLVCMYKFINQPGEAESKFGVVPPTHKESDLTDFAIKMGQYENLAMGEQLVVDRVEDFVKEKWNSHYVPSEEQIKQIWE
jgi:hypothetical protein